MNPTISAEETIYHFDDITVDAENFRVQKNGEIITLTPRAFDVLLFLLQNAGRVVEKREIFEAVWKANFVSDNALTKVIKEIRHALEDSADEPRFIETVPKRGYRFIAKLEAAPVQPVTEAKSLSDPDIIIAKTGDPDQESVPPSHQKIPPRNFSKSILALAILGLAAILPIGLWLSFRPKPAETGSAAIRTIAVLPFKPLNADSRDESLEMGMAETLITRLSNLNQVVVRPMSAVRKYIDAEQDPVKAGQETQSEAVLDGSIQKAGERVRVTVRLTDVRQGKTLWSEQFDENFTDIFKVQDSISERIANALTLRLSRQEQEQLTKHLTDNADAYQLYLRGQLLWHRRLPNWIDQSLSYYQQALEKDPNFALAHVGVAECYIMLSGHTRITTQEAQLKARPGIMKALEIDPNLAQAHNALAELKYQYEYDWTGAEKEFKKAIELNPNVAWIRQAYGWFLMCMARFDEATVEMEKARALDPSSLTINVGRGRLYYYSRQYDQAIQHFQNIIAVEPTDSSSYYSLYTIYEQKKMYAEAFEAWLKSQSLSGMPPERAEEFREAFRVAGWEGVLRKQLEGMEKKAGNPNISPPNLGNLYVRLGRKEEAFAWFEKLFQERHISVLQFKIEPAYDILRDDPRYARLVRRINLEP